MGFKPIGLRPIVAVIATTCEAYGTIDITGKVMNPVVVRGLPMTSFDSSKHEAITPSDYAPEVAINT